MNNKQRLILKITAGIIAVMTIYPPHYYLAIGEDSLQEEAFDWIVGGYGRVDVQLLLAQFIAVGVIAGITCWLKK